MEGAGHHRVAQQIIGWKHLAKLCPIGGSPKYYIDLEVSKSLSHVGGSLDKQRAAILQFLNMIVLLHVTALLRIPSSYM